MILILNSLNRFTEIGIKNCFDKMEDEENNKFRILEDSLEPIQMDQMTQVILIPFVGILLGAAIMIIELCLKKTFLRKQKSKRKFHTRQKAVSGLPAKKERGIFQRPPTAPAKLVFTVGKDSHTSFG